MFQNINTKLKLNSDIIVTHYFENFLLLRKTVVYLKRNTEILIWFIIFNGVNYSYLVVIQVTAETNKCHQSFILIGIVL